MHNTNINIDTGLNLVLLNTNNGEWSVTIVSVPSRPTLKDVPTATTTWKTILYLKLYMCIAYL